jgi:hypothetical protein
MRTYGLFARSVYIYEVAKSLGFYFGTKKEKAKPKGFAMCVAGNPLDFCAALIIAEPLANILFLHYVSFSIH